MGGINGFRLAMIVGIVMSFGLGIPFLVPAWIYGEIVYAKIESKK